MGNQEQRKWGIFLLVLLTLAAIVSCRSARVVEKPVLMERVSHDTIRLTKWQHDIDTILIHDSIIVDFNGQRQVYRTERVSRNSARIDTAYISRTDTVPKPYKVETIREVARKLFWWQTMLQYAGGLFSLALLALIAYAVRFIIRKTKRS